MSRVQRLSVARVANIGQLAVRVRPVSIAATVERATEQRWPALCVPPVAFQARRAPTDPKGACMKERFSRFATATSEAAGSYLAFVIAALIVIVWAVSGPIFKFSTTWQLVINTGTTIVTFLMVFLIQNSQNRESRATQLKLDELIRAVSDASNRMIDIEGSTEEDLNRIREEYRNLRANDGAKAPEIDHVIEEKVKEHQDDVDDKVKENVEDHVGRKVEEKVDEHEAELHGNGARQRPTRDKAA
jgi:low affinity Fe/Cu permease